MSVVNGKIKIKVLFGKIHFGDRKLPAAQVVHKPRVRGKSKIKPVGIQRLIFLFTAPVSALVQYFPSPKGECLRRPSEGGIWVCGPSDACTHKGKTVLRFTRAYCV